MPENPYSISKREIESLSDQYEIHCKSLRLAQLIGWGEENAGFMFRTFLDKALKNEDLTVFGKGSGTRDYLYAKDAAEAIACALEFPEKKGIYNIGSGQNTSHLEFARLISKIFSQGRSRIHMDEKQAEDKSHFQIDTAKSRSAFNWKSRYSLEEAFIDMKKALVSSADT